MKRKKVYAFLGDIIGLLLCFIIFVIPFIFMLSNSLKDRKMANRLTIYFPKNPHWENFKEVFETGELLTAFKNSGLLVIFSVAILVIVGSMAGYVMQRRHDGVTKVANVLLMSALMIPPAILPTIWVMQGLGIYKTLFGMVLVEAALQMSFTVILYRGFMGTIPIEMEEAAYIDGCKPFSVYTKIILPLLKPVTATVIILDSVTIFNDFTNPLYFLPGLENRTVQQTLYDFTGKYRSSYNLLFADVLLITLPMLILFLIFNKKIIAGMVAGAVKG